jgi:hypothetical protein
MFPGLPATKMAIGSLCGFFLTLPVSQESSAQMIPMASWKRLAPKVQYVGVSESYENTSSSTITTAPFAGNPVTGDLIVCSLAYSNSRTISNVTDGNGNTYVPILDVVMVEDAVINKALYYKENITGGTNRTVTATFSGNTTYREFSCHEFSGLILSGSLDRSGSSGSATNQASISTGPAVAKYTKELVFSFIPTVSTAETAGSGFTPISTQDGNMVEYKIVTAPGNYNITATFSPDTAWDTIYATFRSQ